MVDRLAEGPVSAAAQPDEGATYAKKIEKEEGRIDWREPADVIERKLRALNPWPGCFAHVDGLRLRLLSGTTEGGSAPGVAEAGMVLDGQLRIACGDGVLRITRLQKAGGKAMDTAEFLRGHPLPAGTCFDVLVGV